MKDFHKMISVTFALALSLSTIACQSTKPKASLSSQDTKATTAQELVLTSQDEESSSFVNAEKTKAAIQAKKQLATKNNAQGINAVEFSLLNAQMSLLGARPEAALQEAREALKKDNRNVQAMRLLVRAQLELGQLRQAALSADFALSVYPTDADLLNLRGLSAYKSDEHLQAREQWKKALAAQPTHLAAQLNLGALFYEYRLMNLAGASFDKVLALEPSLVDALVGRALVMSAQGNAQGAKDVLKKAEGLAPKNPLVLYNLATIERERFANHQGALEYTEKLLALKGLKRGKVEKALAMREDSKMQLGKRNKALSDSELREMANAQTPASSVEGKQNSTDSQSKEAFESQNADTNENGRVAKANSENKKESSPASAQVADDANSLEDALK